MTVILARRTSRSIPLEEREGSPAWAIETLRECAMSHEEIDAVLASDDPEIVRRHIELHRERLGERLAEQIRALSIVERVLRGAIATRNVGVRGERPGEFLGRSMSKQTTVTAQTT